MKSPHKVRAGMSSITNMVAKVVQLNRELKYSSSMKDGSYGCGNRIAKECSTKVELAYY